MTDTTHTEALTAQPKVAVIILNWNGAALLEEFLPPLLENTDPKLGAIIVADNGSSDNSLELLAEKFPQVEILKFDRNHGFAEGYNLAVAHYAPRYAYTVLLNSDATALSPWLQPLVDFMDSHPGYGACQPKLKSYREPDSFEYAGAAGGFIDRNGFPYCRGRIFDTVEPDHGQYDSVTDLFWATGACLMVRSEVYLKCGGLDKEFFAHMEEIDLCWRMQLAGYKLAVVPESQVYHLGGGSLDATNPRKTYLNFRNNLLMLHKNLPDSSRRSTLLRRRLLDTVAWAKFVATFDWKNANAILKAHRDFAKMSKAYTQHPVADLLHTRPRRPNILWQYFGCGRKHFSDL
ncbi:MAG: glycosyltransferase family 2 protein [Firmicutes bacterium]|nr:glycosyltransferase family 2 protein [Bacillota bacterium]MCM1401816.1 glycosyltransferase family 2 protein [Bacteroides sp.]MCM1477696.1 glycosyltransferase family 2 protein [Bacteroides sp.]